MSTPADEEVRSRRGHSFLTSHNFQHVTCFGQATSGETAVECSVTQYDRTIHEQCKRFSQQHCCNDAIPTPKQDHCLMRCSPTDFVCSPLRHTAPTKCPQEVLRTLVWKWAITICIFTSCLADRDQDENCAYACASHIRPSQ